MNCTDFQNEMSRYLDGDLEPQRAVQAGLHLAECDPCAKSFEEFSFMLDSCRGIEVDEEMPPNAEALWCRISNVRAEPVPQPVSRWNFSFGQAFAAVAVVALVSSLLTVVAVRNYLEPPAEDMVSRSAETETTFEKFLSRLGLSDSPREARERRIREQRAAIEYWDKRVRVRRAQWDQRMQQAFDRNLREIDQAVTEYTRTIENNPDDSLSVEMLDAALNDKMNLLRQFSEL
jgi:hypothetical protein